MPLYGYARVSTADQSTDIQEATLKNAGCVVIRSEKKSGTTRSERSELQTILDFMRPGDGLVITRIDRLARSVCDLQQIALEVKQKGGFIRCVEQPVDTSTAAGKAFFDMLGVFAEFESNLRRERQSEGILRAKQAGKYKGRKATAQAKTAEIRALIDKGIPPLEIARRLEIGKSSVYRIIANVNQKTS